MHFDRELDAKGLKCPLPILRTKKLLSEMASGQVLHILTTDPGSVRDFQAFAKQTGNELLATEATEDTDPMFEFFLKRK
jgi:tRNA 2-thiouridine synthesizing protein A